MTIKILIGMTLAGVLIYFGWLFWWPLIECTYAMSWEPLLSDSFKLMAWLFGGLVFWISMYHGVKFIL